MFLESTVESEKVAKCFISRASAGSALKLNHERTDNDDDAS